MNLINFLLLLFLAGLIPVTNTPLLGVTEVIRTLVFDGEVNIPITPGCDNSFELKDMVHATVKKDFASVQEPFQLQMKVTECVNFTHISTCYVDESWLYQVITHYKMTPRTKDDAPVGAAPEVSVFPVTDVPVLGVTEGNRTMSCCGEVNISIVPDCNNTFEIKDMVYARIKKSGASVLEPFQLQMKVMKCVDFNHTRTCDVDGSRIRQVMPHYKKTTCTKDDASGAAVVPQGSPSSST